MFWLTYFTPQPAWAFTGANTPLKGLQATAAMDSREMILRNALMDLVFV